MVLLKLLQKLTTVAALKTIANEGINQKTIHDTSKFVKTEITKVDKTITLSAGKSLIAVIEKYIPDTSITDATKILKKLNVLIPAIYVDRINKKTKKVMKGDKSIEGAYKLIRKIYIAKWGKQSNIADLSMTLLRFDQKKWKSNKQTADAKVADKNRNPLFFSEIEIYRAMDISKASNDYAMLALGCEMAIGGRMNEILGFSEYTESKEHPGWLKQFKISKQKTDEDTNKSVDKPLVYYTHDEFFSMLKELRKQVKLKKKDNQTYEEFSRSVNGKINREVKKMFVGNENLDEITSHMMRKLYATMSYSLYGSAMSESGWLNTVLAHQRDSVSVAANYSVVKITSKLDKSSAGVANKVSELVAQNKSTDAAITNLADDVENMKESINKTGVAITQVSIPRNIRLRDGKAGDRLKITVAAMEAKNVKITSLKLRALGYGSRIVGQFLKEYKPP
jgi:hypothetical protein